MGYSLRSDRWRYTEWAVWNKTSFQPIWDSVTLNRTELYDHQGDLGTDFDVASPTGESVKKFCVWLEITSGDDDNDDDDDDDGDGDGNDDDEAAPDDDGDVDCVSFLSRPVNQASDPQYEGLITNLSQALRNHFTHDQFKFPTLTTLAVSALPTSP